MMAITEGAARTESTAGTARSRRREQILAASARLFRERGYHSVGIDEIGGAVGITGPGVYRHFKSKQDLLAAVCFHMAEQTFAEVERKIENETPRHRFERMVDNLVDTIVNARELTAIYVREFRHLSEGDRARLRLIYVRYIEDWMSVVREARPSLNDKQARTLLEGLVWLVRSCAFYPTELDVHQLKSQLRSMARAAALAEIPGTRRTTNARSSNGRKKLKGA